MVSWWHPLRNAEVRGFPGAELSYGPKTVATIQRAFASAAAGAAAGAVPTSDILFFDDLIHSAIYNVIPAQNYFHVQPYHNTGNPVIIHQCFLNALACRGIDVTEPWFSKFEDAGIIINDIGSFTSGRTLRRAINDSTIILRRLEKLIAAAAVAL